MMNSYHFFCPADGQKCTLQVEDLDNDSYQANCPDGHGWLVFLRENADSDDGTAIEGFMCHVTHVSAMHDQ